MLFRLLSGQVPFNAEHPLGMAVQHMTEPVPAFRDIAPNKNLPPRLEQIVRRLMEKDPERRYRSAGDLVSELEKFLEDPPLPKPAKAPVGGAVGAGMGAVGASLGLFGVALAAVAIFVALIVVLLFAQAGGSRDVEPALPLPVRPVDPVLPTPPVLPVEPVPVEPRVDPEPAPSPVAPRPSPVKPDPVRPKPAEPKPSPAPAPAPAPEPDPKPAPQPAPDPGSGLLAMPGIPAPGTVPTPSPAPVPAPVSPSPAPQVHGGGSDVFVDEVGFSNASAARALTFVNTATPEELAAAGIYRKGVEIIVAQRPFASLKAFGGTYGIGKKTLQSVRNAK